MVEKLRKEQGPGSGICCAPPQAWFWDSSHCCGEQSSLSVTEACLCGLFLICDSQWDCTVLSFVASYIIHLWTPGSPCPLKEKPCRKDLKHPEVAGLRMLKSLAFLGSLPLQWCCLADQEGCHCSVQYPKLPEATVLPRVHSAVARRVGCTGMGCESSCSH